MEWMRSPTAGGWHWVLVPTMWEGTEPVGWVRLMGKVFYVNANTWRCKVDDEDFIPSTSGHLRFYGPLRPPVIWGIDGDKKHIEISGRLE